jgi:RNA polymerase sigma factor (sigma-70 family)
VAVAARTSGSARTAPFGLLGDERLARLVAAGHERAFAVVYERHHQALYRYCRSIVRNDADAQDALQSTFTAAFAALSRGGPEAPIRPWLFRIAHNEAVSTLRRRRPTVELSDATESWTTSVDDQVAERSRLDLLLRDLRELHDRQRSALVMRELSGLSHEEIALALETSVGAAKQAIYEARQSLFEFAEGRAMPCDEIRRTISDADGRMLRSRRVRAHLRECSACAAFAAAIPERRGELRALVPTLPAAAATGLLGHVAGMGSAHGSSTGLVGLAVGGAGKTAGVALAANALAGVAVVASATVGVTLGVNQLAHAGSPAAAARHGTPTARPSPAQRGTPASAVSPAERAVQHRGVPVPVRTRSSVPARTLMPSRARGRQATAVPAPRAVHASGSSSSVSSSPGHSGSAPGHSATRATIPGHSGAAHGHSSSSSATTPGHSAAGHSSLSSTTSHGHSAAAPGHSSATSATSPGHSGAAPGHTGRTTAATPGQSGAAPGHSPTSGVVIVPPVPLPADAAGNATGAASSSPPGHLK